MLKIAWLNAEKTMQGLNKSVIKKERNIARWVLSQHDKANVQNKLVPEPCVF